MSESLKRWEVVAWVGGGLLGIILAFFRISHGSIWSDEAVTMLLTEHRFGEIFGLVGQGADSHPPLYHYCVKLFTEFFGRSRGVFRGFSAVGLLMAVFAIGIGPVARIFNRRVGLIYTFLMLLATMNLTQAQEMRMYTWATFLITACTTLGYLYARDGRRRDLYLFGLASLGAAYIHYFATLAVFFVHLYLLIWIVTAKRERLSLFLAEVVTVVVLYLPWIFNMLNQVSRNVKHFWIPRPNLEIIITSLAVPFITKTGYMSYVPVLMLACFGLYLLGVVAAFHRRENPVFLMLAAGVFFSVFVAAIGISLFIRPILVPRYMLPLWGGVFIGVAWGLYQLFRSSSRRLKVMASVFMLIYAILAVPALNLLYFYQLNGPMDEVVQFGHANIKSGEVFLHFDDVTLSEFVLEFPGSTHLLYQTPASTFDDPLDYLNGRITIVHDLKELLSYGGIWFVSSPDSVNSLQYREVISRFGVDPNQVWLWGEEPFLTALPGAVGRTIRFATPYSDSSIDMTLVKGR